MAISTQTITLEDLPTNVRVPSSENELRELRQPAAAMGRRVQTARGNPQNPSPAEPNSTIATDEQHNLPPPSTTPWLKLKIFGAAFSFFCAGINDSILGPLIPYMLVSFSIGTGEIAIL